MFGKKNSSTNEFDNSSNALESSGHDDLAHDSSGESFEVPPPEVANNSADTLESLAAPIISKPSILSQGFEFEGTIKTTGALIISGRIIGTIDAGAITIENEGTVDGEIRADSLTVKGKVLGEIRCLQLTVGPNAHVDADSYFDTIEVQRGGKISGLLNKA